MIERIMMEAVKFKCVTGRSATSIYLGRSEFNLLRNDKDECMAFRYGGGYGRSKACGLDVFVVDIESHFNIA